MNEWMKERDLLIEETLAFAQGVAANYMSPAFGARSKTKIDLLVFSSLVESGAIDPEAGGALAERVARPAADKAVNFLVGLLTGDVKAATKSLEKDDLIEA
jgi:hypothetical protein